MSDIFDKQRRAPRWLVAVPFVVVLAVLLIEVETPQIRVTPSLLTIALAIFALFLSPRAVLWWAVVLFVPVLRVLDALGPVASNNIAAVVVKPDLPEEKFPWLEQRGKEWASDPVWFSANGWGDLNKSNEGG